MHGSLAIALNPQIYIQNYGGYPKVLSEAIGYDISGEDPFNRNNLYPQLHKSKSSYCLLFNLQSTLDCQDHAIPLLKEMGISPTYGLTEKDNILMWMYDCVGTPDPHGSFETKSIFFFIDYIAKRFQKRELSSLDKDTCLLINECWHDYYLQKKLAKKKAFHQEFIFMDGDRTFHEEFPLLHEEHDIFLEARDYHATCHAYRIPVGFFRYSVRIAGLEADYEEFTAGVFDSKNYQVLHYEKYDISSDTVIFNFCLGKQVVDLSICIYAGVHGYTHGKSLGIGKFEVRAM